MSPVPRPDRFVPDLLLGFFHDHCNGETNHGVRWQPSPRPFESILPVIAGSDDDTPGYFTPAASNNNSAAAGVDMAALYVSVLSSRDGFLLLDGGHGVGDLCLCNPMTAACTFVPRVAFPAAAYSLVTGYDLNDDLGVRIVAMEGETTGVGFVTIRYQVSSPMSGDGGKAGPLWGQVRSSPPLKVKEEVTAYHTEIVCGGAIHLLVKALFLVDGTQHTCILGVDVRTGRSWMREVPEQCRLHKIDGHLALATSRDGRLSLVMYNPAGSLSEIIDVWVLLDDDQWTLQRTIHVPNMRWMNNNAFCPRSGCLLAVVEAKNNNEQELVVVDVESGLSRPLRCLYPKDPDKFEIRYPYEMDWSTYLSRMKCF